jgi:hypothetical protein
VIELMLAEGRHFTAGLELNQVAQSTPQRMSRSSSIAENACPNSESILTLKPFNFLDRSIAMKKM